MFLPVRKGSTVAVREMQILKERMKSNDCYIEHFKYHFRDKREPQSIQSPREEGPLQEENQAGVKETRAAKTGQLRGGTDKAYKRRHH